VPVFEIVIPEGIDVLPNFRVPKSILVGETH
jgi:hypothetical protein